MKTIILKIILFLLSITLGLVFIYSGYTKLYPIEPFELTFVDIGISGWKLAPFIARFMIGLEFFIGIMLISSLYVKFTQKLTIATLAFFCVYLLLVILNTGNNGNCGCFGNAISMTPLQAIIKNIIMIAASLVLLIYHKGINLTSLGKWLSITFAFTSLAMPHILNYVDFSYSQAYLTKKEDQFKLELDSVYKDAKKHTPPKSLSNGKHVLAFMSLTCPHCRIAAKKMKLIKEKNPAISIYFILNGEDKNINPFFEETKATNIDYCILNGKNFVYLAGLDMPAIYMINNSVVEHWVNYMELDQSEIENWLAKP
jgi:uncharacterized membrane protein YphA (DoxX/SURF4 family)